MKTTRQTQRWYGYFFIGLSVLALILAGLLPLALVERALILTTAVTLMAYGISYQSRLTRGWWLTLVVIGGGLILLDLVVALMTPALFLTFLEFLLPLTFLVVLLGYLRRLI
ncbi:hypothetical protein [Levilactobacillus lindianensis]|uniref:hypothetical protein n=1 Tax=Levilactobacillus lindianensis TaxID=2486018 RepID=UPI000F744139|nr:hypothetical protein [Levilactobacillus lindianensis]